MWPTLHGQSTTEREATAAKGRDGCVDQPTFCKFDCLVTLVEYIFLEPRVQFEIQKNGSAPNVTRFWIDLMGKRPLRGGPKSGI